MEADRQGHMEPVCLSDDSSDDKILHPGDESECNKHISDSVLLNGERLIVGRIDIVDQHDSLVRGSLILIRPEGAKYVGLEQPIANGAKSTVLLGVRRKQYSQN